MCCCEKANKNGEPGYRWQPEDAPSVRTADAPDLGPDDVLLFDLPGRCRPSVAGEKGETDYHSHHYRVVSKRGAAALLVRHGGGDERQELGYSYRKAAQLFGALPNDDARYLLASLLDSVQDDAARAARAATQIERRYWIDAAKEGRIKTRKRRGSSVVDVRVEVHEAVAP